MYGFYQQKDTLREMYQLLMFSHKQLHKENLVQISDTLVMIYMVPPLQLH